MSNIRIVFLREFIQRLKSKGFILSTLLAPLGMLVFIGILAISAMAGLSNEDHRTIAVIDEGGEVVAGIKMPPNYTLKPSKDTPENLRKQVLDETLDGYMVIPAAVLQGKGEVVYYSRGGGGLSFQLEIQRAVNQAVRALRLDHAKVSPDVRALFESETNVTIKEITAQGEKADATGALTGLAFVMAFLIYMMMFIYGSLVMQSVIEEKLNRVMEVMVSSVRPFDLLMGKVMGMGVLGVVQIVAWTVLSMGIMSAAGPIILLFLKPNQMNLPNQATQQQVLEKAGFVMPELHLMMFVWFALFFVGGYLLYASYFAAVGSAVESPQDAQQLMMPITLLIIIPMLFINSVIMNPDGGLATALSIIPFFAPILMPARIMATDVPIWQPTLAFILLTLTFLGAIWVSGRIYRVGVLSYGKKPSLLDLMKWVRMA